jgi:hypothetical protein
MKVIILGIDGEIDGTLGNAPTPMWQFSTRPYA